MAFEDEIEDIVRGLNREAGVLGVVLGDVGEAPFGDVTGAEIRRAPLGEGSELAVLAREDAPLELSAAIERAARALRACSRRFGQPVPEHTRFQARTRRTLVDRIERYLEAFAGSHGATGVALLRGAELIAVGGSLDDAEADRLAFLRKRVDVEAEKNRGKSSHGEVIGDDVYACSFWFDAYLVAFFARPYSLDFVRHRARAVGRELAAILPHLDEPPTAPAKVSPLPD